MSKVLFGRPKGTRLPTSLTSELEGMACAA